MPKDISGFDCVEILGARTHNLKNIDLIFPRNQLIVITGISGSGKSSLAFDTIYAEGQRRYRESLTAYARQFLGNLTRPEVDKINGLSPVIAIEQKTINQHSRSTVGTITEIYDFMRLLFARIAIPYSYLTNNEMVAQSEAQIMEQLLRNWKDQMVTIMAPIIRGRKGQYEELLSRFIRMGFHTIRLDGTFTELSSDLKLERYKKHDIMLVIDHIVVDRQDINRIKDTLQLAMAYGNGTMIVIDAKQQDHFFSTSLVDVSTGLSYDLPAPNLFSFNTPYGACESCNGLGELPEGSKELVVCPDCAGSRLNKIALSFKIKGKNIAQLAMMNLTALQQWFLQLTKELTDREEVIAKDIIQEISKRLQFLLDVGLQYLQLNRGLKTLSGGEAQRIRLAAQIGAQLVGILYILDEPSIGLHPRDNTRLITALKALRDMGNTILVVEHDREIMLEADYLIEIGPQAGIYGGEVVAAGRLPEFLAKPSITGDFLTYKRNFPSAQGRKRGSGKHITLTGCSGHNLKNITLTLPLGVIICVTGVSGSGKSSLVRKTLLPIIKKHLHTSHNKPLPYKEVMGLEHIQRVIEIDQTTIGRTPRSNPITYMEAFTDIRNFFAMLPEAQMRAYKASRFSFNLKEGRCNSCEGIGMQRIEMGLLPDVDVVCEVCGGKRYNRESLEIQYKGKSIADILAMTVSDALSFFKNHPSIYPKLHMLAEVGLGYITLGQHATTLSGGEAQRIKLALELAQKSKGNTLYILDEPTTGLHFQDIVDLLAILKRLVDQGDTVLIIEHNMDLIKVADYIIDMGPEGGDMGGFIVAEGRPEVVAKVEDSYTGAFLKKELAL